MNSCLTGSIPTASRASVSVSRMFKKPSPRSELSRKRFWVTVSRTAIGSGSWDRTRRPSTMSCNGSPSSAYIDASAAPNLAAKCPSVRDRLPSQIASTCWLASPGPAVSASKRPSMSLIRSPSSPATASS